MKWIKLYEDFNEKFTIDIVNPEWIKNNSLYHCTTEKNAINILKYNYFRPSKGIVGIMGLSTTFDSEYIWNSSDVKFVLDYLKLKNDYTLIYIDEKIGVDESEIKIVTETPILNIEKYIKDIEYFGSNIELNIMIKNILNKAYK